MGNVYTLSRIRQGRTNYRKREKLLVGRTDFVSVKVSSQNVCAQVLAPQKLGDKVLASVHSHDLLSFGWKGSLKNLPACYLVGLLLGKKCEKKGLKHVCLYTGIRPFTTRIAAFLKGLTEGGVTLPHSSEVLPDDQRISGTHIADFVKSMEGVPDKYRHQFSSLLSRGLNPKDYPEHFSAVKNAILESNLHKLSKMRQNLDVDERGIS
jgi:large subunit ribosomal protein L18